MILKHYSTSMKCIYFYNFVKWIFLLKFLEIFGIEEQFGVQYELIFEWKSMIEDTWTKSLRYPLCINTSLAGMNVEWKFWKTEVKFPTSTTHNLIVIHEWRKGRWNYWNISSKTSIVHWLEWVSCIPPIFINMLVYKYCTQGPWIELWITTPPK